MAEIFHPSYDKLAATLADLALSQASIYRTLDGLLLKLQHMESTGSVSSSETHHHPYSAPPSQPTAPDLAAAMRELAMAMGELPQQPPNPKPAQSEPQQFGPLASSFPHYVRDSIPPLVVQATTKTLQYRFGISEKQSMLDGFDRSKIVSLFPNFALCQLHSFLAVYGCFGFHLSSKRFDHTIFRHKWDPGGVDFTNCESRASKRTYTPEQNHHSLLEFHLVDSDSAFPNVTHTEAILNEVWRLITPLGYFDLMAFRWDLWHQMVPHGVPNSWIFDPGDVNPLVRLLSFAVFINRLCSIFTSLPQFLPGFTTLVYMTDSALNSAIVLGQHLPFSWLIILTLRLGLTGAAFILNKSWWLVISGHLMYIFLTKFQNAYCGFIWLLLANLCGHAKLYLALAVMSCLEFWHLTDRNAKSLYCRLIHLQEVAKAAEGRRHSEANKSNHSFHLDSHNSKFGNQRTSNVRSISQGSLASQHSFLLSFALLYQTAAETTNIDLEDSESGSEKHHKSSVKGWQTCTSLSLVSYFLEALLQ